MSKKPDDNTKFEGFEQANTTPVPDVLFDELLEKLSGAELKVLLYIIRRTKGFKKDTDAISLSQFEHGITTRDGKKLDCGCGIKRRQTIIDALASLERMGYIISHKTKTSDGDAATTVYQIRFNGVVSKPDYLSSSDGSFKTGLPSDETGLGVVAKTVPPVVSKPYPQETVIQQTELQERTKKKSSSPSPSFHVVDTAIRETDVLEKTIADYSEIELRRFTDSQLYALLSSKQKDILQRWRALFKAPVKLDGKLARALYDLEPYDPPAETLEAIRRYCFTIDRPTDNFPKGYYKTRGVKLWDIVEHYADWQQTQEPIPRLQTTNHSRHVRTNEEIAHLPM